LTELGCTRPFDGKDFVLVVDWLLWHSTSLTYQDRGTHSHAPCLELIFLPAEEYTQEAAELKEKTFAESELKRIDENTDCTYYSVSFSTYCMLADNSEEFKKQVATLARLLQLPESDNVEEVLQVCFFSRVVAFS